MFLRELVHKVGLNLPHTRCRGDKLAWFKVATETRGRTAGSVECVHCVFSGPAFTWGGRDSLPTEIENTPNSKSPERARSRGIVDSTKEYSFVLSTMPRLHARSRLLELGVVFGSRDQHSSLIEVINDNNNNNSNFIRIITYSTLPYTTYIHWYRHIWK